MKVWKVVTIVAVALVAMSIIVNERVTIVSKNVDDIHQDSLEIHKAMEARIAGLELQVARLTQIALVQNRFVNDAFKEEMGKRNFDKFTKEWIETVQPKEEVK